MSHFFFPLKLHSSHLNSSLPCPQNPAEVPRRLHSQERGFSWGPQRQETWRLGDFSKVLVARMSSHHPLGALGSMVPARANRMLPAWEQAQLRALTLTVSAPLLPSHGTQAWSGSRDWKAAQGREIRGDKIGITLFCSLTSC